MNKKKSAFFLCVCMIFFAAVIMSAPVSRFIGSGLAGQLESSFGSKPEHKNSGLKFLSLSGFSGLDKYTGIPLVIINNIDNYIDLTEPDDLPVLNIQENIRVQSDDSIMSIQELYEYYADYGAVKIEEATFGSLEIPAGEYKITPRNFSGQNTARPKLLMTNETSYNIDINDFLKRDYPVSSFDINRQDEPVILIVHTHSTESYVIDGTYYYSPPFTAERTTDINKNVVLVGAALKNKLQEYNIPVIHSLKMHDAVSYRDSYLRALETIQDYIGRYPSIKYVIDVHRDSMIAETGEKYKPTVKIDGADAAQVMIVTGTDDGGASHPSWRDNLTFTAHFQQKMNSKYPMLARPVNLRAARFNQHITGGSIILEIGSCGSTFGEALRAAELVGECLSELILEHN